MIFIQIILLFFTRVKSNSILKILIFSVGFTCVLFFRNLNEVLDISLYMDEMTFLKNNSIFESSLAWKGDYLFLLILKILSYFDKYLGILIYFFISMLFFLKQLLRLSKNNNLSFGVLLLFVFSSLSFYLMFGNTLRQGLAFSFILGSFNNFNKNKIWFMFYFICAFMSHKSVIIFLLPFIIIYFKNYKKITFFLLLPFFLFIYSYLLNNLISLKFTQYSSLTNPDIFNDFIKLIAVTVVFVISTFILKNKFTIFHLTILCIIIVSFVFINMPIISSRLLLFAQLIIPIILAHSYKEIQFKSNFNLKKGVVIYSLIFFLIMINTKAYISLMSIKL